MSFLPIPLLPASYVTCLGTGTRQQRLENVFHSFGKRQSWTRLGNDVSKLPGRYILNNRAVYGSCRLGPCWRWKWNLGVGTLRPLPGILQKLLPVTGILRLQWVYLSSFWQYDQNYCTKNSLDLVHVEVIAVDWIFEPWVVSSGPVVGCTAGCMVFLGTLVPLLAFPLEPSVNTEN